MNETQLALGLGGVLLAPVILIAALLELRGVDEVIAAEPAGPIEETIELPVEQPAPAPPAPQLASEQAPDGQPVDGAARDADEPPELDELQPLELPPGQDLPAATWLGGPPLAFPLR